MKKCYPSLSKGRGRCSELLFGTPPPALQTQERSRTHHPQKLREELALSQDWQGTQRDITAAPSPHHLIQQMYVQAIKNSQDAAPAWTATRPHPASWDLVPAEMRARVADGLWQTRRWLLEKGKGYGTSYRDHAQATGGIKS